MEDRQRLIAYARANRKEMAVAEWLLWTDLSGRKLGHQFRRQDPIGPYIADFSCRQRRLVIEIDDPSHEDRFEHDRLRDKWMLANGWFVLRIGDNEVLDNPTETLDLIEQALEDPSKILLPLGYDPDDYDSPPR